MKNLLPLWVWPLNIFQVHGSMCCYLMHQHYKTNPFTHEWGCYDAKSIQEANLLIIWGSVSHKLSLLVLKQTNLMLENRFIIHVRGCSERIDNTYTSSAITNIPINSVFSDCNLSTPDYRLLIKEARQCSIA